MLGPIRHCEPPHAALPFTRCRYCRVARRLHIDVYNDDDDNDNALQRGPLWPHGMGLITYAMYLHYCFVCGVILLYLRRDAKYCDEYVCLSICMSARISITQQEGLGVASIARDVVEMTPPLFPACTATQRTSVTDRQTDTDIVA